MPVTPDTHAPHRRRVRAHTRGLSHRLVELDRPGGVRTGHALLEVLHGDWASIRRAAQARVAAGRRPAAGDQIRLALSSALLGDLPTARTAAARAESLDPHDVSVAHDALVARAMTHLVAGEPAASFTLLLDLPRTDAVPFAGVGLLAGSAYRAGRPAAAAHLLAVDDASAPAAVRDEYAVARAYVGDDDPAGFAPGAAFARGRVALARGMRRRRARDEVAARAHLATALDLFRATGATPWVDFAANELRASGHRVAGAATDLTDRQLAIVRLAAAGLSNQQIADRLFLSTRTVGTHLYRSFPKLGVTSRHQLPSALLSDGS